MLTTTRTLALLAGAVALLGACSGSDEQAVATAVPAVALKPAPPGLWAVDLVDEKGVILGASRVCDDGSLRAALARGMPMPGGQPCALGEDVVVSPDAFTAQCKAGGLDYVVETDPQGELGRIFTMDMTLKSSGPPPSEMKQMARVRRIGDCPADWVNGDAAAANTSDVTNMFTGATKTASAVR